MKTKLEFYGIMVIIIFFMGCSDDDDETTDTTSPKITLLGDAEVSIPLGTPYDDAGATASDNIDGNLTASIIVSNPVDVNVLGLSTIIYNVSDASGNSTTLTRNVNVVPAEFSTATVPYETYFDLETEIVCSGFGCELSGGISDPDDDLIFAYAGGNVNARMWWNSSSTDMALVFDKSFDELSFFYVSDYYFCKQITDTNTACANTDTEPTNFVGLYKTNEGNYFAVEFISEDSSEGITFRYKLLE